LLSALHLDKNGYHEYPDWKNDNENIQLSVFPSDGEEDRFLTLPPSLSLALWGGVRLRFFFFFVCQRFSEIAGGEGLSLHHASTHECKTALSLGSTNPNNSRLGSVNN